MDGLIEIEPFATLTPGRRTIATFDGTDTRLIEDHWSVRRIGEEVNAVGARIGGRSDVATARYWKSLKCWTMIPIIESPDVFVDRISSAPGDTIIYRPDATTPEFRTAVTSQTKVIAGHRKSENVDADPSAPSSTDPGLRKFVTKFGPVMAGREFLPSSPGPFLTPPTPSATTVVPIDTQAITEIPLPEDRANFIRFTTPQQVLGVPNGEIIKYFFGQYCLVVNGNGKAQLHELARPINNPSTEQWVFRFEFRFTRNAIGVSSHIIGIFPFYGLTGERYIIFTTDGGEEHLYTASDPSNGRYMPGAPSGCVTRAGNLRVDVRRDFRPKYTFGPVLWVNNATIDDQPVATPPVIFNSRPLNVRTYHDWRSQANDFADGPTDPIPAGARSGYISIGFQAIDGTVYTPPNFSDAIGMFVPNFVLLGNAPGDALDNPNLITVAGLGTLARRTPVLWGYQIWRNARLSVATGSPFSPDIRGFTFTGDEGDPQQVKATIAVSDPMGLHPRLRRRSFLPVSVSVQWTPPGASVPIQTRIFSGYSMRNREQQMGKYDTRTFRELGLYKPANVSALLNDLTAGPVTTDGPPGARLYPSPEWREYQCLATGPWYRLNITTTRSALDFKYFSVDPDAPKEPSGTQPPWRVTDAIKYMLSAAGFEADQIAIEDNPIRLFAGLGTDQKDQLIDINSNVGERIVTLARNYLGAFLIYDFSHGTRGAWRLIVPLPENTPPVFRFTRFGPATPWVPPHTLSAYPPNTAFCIGPPEGYWIKPEGNHLQVFTSPKLKGGDRFRYERHFWNHKSYDVPGGYFEPADPDSPHYIGSEELIVAAFPELYVTGTQTAFPWVDTLIAGSLTGSALTFVGRRIFDYACRARRVENLYCPLMFVNVGGNYRMLRFGDPVTLDGSPELGTNGWFVRSCSVEIESDNAQMMRVQVEKLWPYP